MADIQYFFVLKWYFLAQKTITIGFTAAGKLNVQKQDKHRFNKFYYFSANFI